MMRNENNKRVKCWPVIEPDGFIFSIECENGEREAVDSHDWFI